jgi:hypothetical protein
MKASLTLKILCDSAETVSMLASVLKPDNKVPSGQTFSMEVQDRSLTVQVESEMVKSAFTSVNSVLVDASLFQEILLLTRESTAGASG